MKNVIVNKEAAFAWIKDYLCFGDENLSQHMIWALGEDLQPLEEYSYELSPNQARSYADTSSLSHVFFQHAQNYRFVEFSPESIPEEFMLKLELVRDSIQHALDRNDPWITKKSSEQARPKNLKGRFDKVYERAELYAHQNRTNFLAIPECHSVAYREDCVDHIEYGNGQLITKEDLGNILTFNTYGRFELECFGFTSQNYNCRLQEGFSGLRTGWEYNLGHSVDFKGWGFDIQKTGRGLLKPLLANRVALADEFGCREMHSMFGMMGAYVFARAGFVPAEDSWIKLRTDILKRLSDLEDEIGITPELSERVRQICAQDSPSSIWEIADLKDPVKETYRIFGIEYEIKPNTIGKYLLMDNIWEGTFNLDNPKQMQRLAQFVGPDVLDKSFQNVREICAARNVAPSLDMAL